MKSLCSLGIIGSVLLSGMAWAQPAGTVNSAFQVARSAVNSEIQTKVISAYGVGTPTAIQKWYFIFFDPTVPTHGRAVLVQDGKITKTYPAAGGVTYSSQLTFDPSRITSEVPALSAAQTYAAKHHLRYDAVRALLKQVSINKPFRWKIDLYDNGNSRGYVLINAIDDSVAGYVSPSADSTPATAKTTDSGATGFGHDVQKTFLGIGGDLEEFFTGNRTVDKK